MIRLLDGDGRGDAVDGIDLRLVHPVHELPGVGRKSLHVAALALGVDGVEGEAGLAAAAGSRDDIELPKRDIEVESLQVILTDTANLDGIAMREGGRGLFQGTAKLAHAGRYFKCPRKEEYRGEKRASDGHSGTRSHNEPADHPGRSGPDERVRDKPLKMKPIHDAIPRCVFAVPNGETVAPEFLPHGLQLGHVVADDNFTARDKNKPDLRISPGFRLAGDAAWMGFF